MPSIGQQLLAGYWTKERLPSMSKVKGVAAWGGVAVSVALFAVQPWDWLAENMGFKKDEEKH